jgi:hypothetical protein
MLTSGDADRGGPFGGSFGGPVAAPFASVEPLAPLPATTRAAEPPTGPPGTARLRLPTDSIRFSSGVTDGASTGGEDGVLGGGTVGSASTDGVLGGAGAAAASTDGVDGALGAGAASTGCGVGGASTDGVLTTAGVDGVLGAATTAGVDGVLGAATTAGVDGVLGATTTAGVDGVLGAATAPAATSDGDDGTGTGTAAGAGDGAGDGARAAAGVVTLAVGRGAGAFVCGVGVAGFVTGVVGGSADRTFAASLSVAASTPVDASAAAAARGADTPTGFNGVMGTDDVARDLETEPLPRMASMSRRSGVCRERIHTPHALTGMTRGHSARHTRYNAPKGPSLATGCARWASPDRRRARGTWPAPA